MATEAIKSLTPFRLLWSLRLPRNDRFGVLSYIFVSPRLMNVYRSFQVVRRLYMAGSTLGSSSTLGRIMLWD